MVVYELGSLSIVSLHAKLAHDEHSDLERDGAWYGSLKDFGNALPLLFYRITVWRQLNSDFK